MKKLKYLFALLFITTSLFAQGLDKNDYFQKLLFNPLSNTTVAPRYQFDILPFGNQLGNLGSLGTTWNLIYGDTAITNAVLSPYIIGGTASGGALNLSSTTHATKGKIYFGTASVYDQVNDRFGIGTVPGEKLQIKATGSIGTTYPLSILNSNGIEKFRVSDDGSITGIDFYSANILNIRGGNQVDISAINADSYITFKTVSAEKVRINSAGNVGVATTAPDKITEINLGTSNALRLTYNDADGSAAVYSDFTLSSTGVMTITPVGSTPQVTVVGIVGNSTQQTITLGVGATTLAVTKNVITVTGNAGANTLATLTGAVVGTYVFIFVDGLVTITDNDSHAANSVDLAGTATNFVSADDKTLTLVYDGTSWYQISSSIN